MTPDTTLSELVVLVDHPDGLRVAMDYDATQRFVPPPWMESELRSRSTAYRTRLDYDCLRARPTHLRIRGRTVSLGGGPLPYSETKMLQKCIGAWRDGEFGDVPFDEDANITSAGLLVAVISHEGLLLLPRRSATLATMPGLWAAGLGEGLEPVDFESGKLDAGVRRTLLEEIAIAPESVPDSAIRVLGLMQSPRSLALTFFVPVDFRGMGEAFVAKHLLNKAAAARDAWEHAELRFIEPSRVALEGVLNATGVGACPGTTHAVDMLAAYLR